ncbi:MAG: hypothetical protein JO030_03825 [Candidatus Eremiobacteraeota bacterium]|nr:hypothetical protein [Candidatus Eremiobacteraeota bacterium]
MHDVATLVWVVLIVVGVVSSIASSARRHAATPVRRVQQAVPPTSRRPQPVTPSAPARPNDATAATARAPAPRSKRLFGTKRDAVRAIVVAEILGKPKALRGEDFPV